MQPTIDYITPASPAAFPRKGYWWSTMGFTNVHRYGVFITESVMCTGGLVLALLAIPSPPQLSLRLLLGAACCFLMAVVVLLASILSLLFYLDPRRG